MKDVCKVPLQEPLSPKAAQKHLGWHLQQAIICFCACSLQNELATAIRQRTQNSRAASALFDPSTLSGAGTPNASNDPPAIPNLVLGPDGQTLAVAMANVASVGPAGSGSLAAENADPVMYTASLSLDDNNEARGLLPVDLLALSSGRTLTPSRSLRSRTSRH